MEEVSRQPMSKQQTSIFKARGSASQKDPPSQESTVTTALAEVDTSTAFDLVRSAADLVQASIAENTRRAYRAALRQFERSEYPETDTGVAAYLGRLYDMGRSVAVAAMLVSALRFRARLRGLPSPVGAATTRVLAGFRRLAAGRGMGQVAGVRWEQADRVAAMAEQRNHPIGLRDAAIVAVASDALLRVSEVSSLDVEDVNLAEQTLLIRRSKTDQEGKGVLQFLGKPTVERIRAWLLKTGLAEGPLFRAVHRSGSLRRGRLAERSIRRIIIVRAKAAGVDGRVSGHSLRVGSAQSLAMAGASLVEMQVAGRWRSPAMPARYAQGQLVTQGAVARLRYGS